MGALGCVPGNGGDISVLVPEATASDLYPNLPPGGAVPFAELDGLRDIRGDGRHYYRAQGTTLTELDVSTEALNGRLLLTTTSGAKIWDIARDPERHLCFTTIQRDHFILHDIGGRTPVPTTEFVNHVAGHATNITAGLLSSTVMHVHPQKTIDLSRHSNATTFEWFNYHLYMQRIEQLANIPELVAFIPFAMPGSNNLAKKTATAFRKHRVVIWQAHGIIVREQDLERCIDLLQYTEVAAAAALNAFAHGNLWRPSREQLATFVAMYHLPDDFLRLLDQMEQQ